MRIQTSEPGYSGFENDITHVCLCGSQWFNIQVSFEDYEISAYLLDMTCAVCDTAWTAPTEADRP